MTEDQPWEAVGVSQKSYEDFFIFWERFQRGLGGDAVPVPRVIVWLNGAPGAGKGTNASYIQDIFGITQPPLVTSDLLDSQEFRAIKDSGRLVNDGDVTSLVFSRILNRKYVSGVVVDGYPRTAAQAECVKLLAHVLEKLGKVVDFQVVILDVSENTSVERQLGRGRRALEHNERVRVTGRGEKIPIRPTDVDPQAARTRYQVFVQQTDDALRILGHEFPCHRIQAEKSPEEVSRAIYASFGDK